MIIVLKQHFKSPYPFFFFFLIIVDSQAVVGNNTERSLVHFAQFCPVVTFCKTSVTSQPLIQCTYLIQTFPVLLVLTCVYVIFSLSPV